VTNALNGRPVVRFYGSNYFNLPNVLNGTTQAEAFVVLKAAADTPTTARGLWTFGGYGYVTGNYPNTSGTIVDDFGTYNTLQAVGNPVQPLDQYHLYEAAAQSGSWMAWVNGVLQCSSTYNNYGIRGTPTLGLSTSY